MIKISPSDFLQETCMERQKSAFRSWKCSPTVAGTSRNVQVSWYAMLPPQPSPTNESNSFLLDTESEN